MAAGSTTFAEGLATRVPFDLPQRILRERLSDFVLVDDDEIREAVVLMIEHTRTLVEPAGAAALAVLLADPAIQRPVVVVLSGGNLDAQRLSAWLAA